MIKMIKMVGLKFIRNCFEETVDKVFDEHKAKKVKQDHLTNDDQLRDFLRSPLTGAESSEEDVKVDMASYVQGIKATYDIMKNAT